MKISHLFVLVLFFALISFFVAKSASWFVAWLIEERIEQLPTSGDSITLDMYYRRVHLQVIQLPNNVPCVLLETSLGNSIDCDWSDAL